jgi:hypothetical protein
MATKDGGKGNSSFTPSQTRENTSKPKTRLEDTNFDIGPAATRFIEFTRNMKFILNYLERTVKGGGDITTALEQKQKFDFDKVKPQPKVSTRFLEVG